MKWEYLTARFVLDQGVVESELNGYGAQGWELVKMHYVKHPTTGVDAFIDVVMKRERTTRRRKPAP